MRGLIRMSRTAIHTVLAYGRWGYVALRSRLRSSVKGRGTPRGQRMLLLAWRLPPSVTGGVYRPWSFLRYAPQNGWEISAIAGPMQLTADEPGKWLLERLPRSTTIHRVAESELRPSWRWFPRVDGGFINALEVANFAYVKLRNDPPDVVMASGPPFHNFIAAYYVARRYGAKLVLDYRDEWSVGTNDFVRLGNCDRKWESFCLEKADAIVFVTQGFLDLYLETFNKLDASKCHLITNGWDEGDFPTASASVDIGSHCKEDKITISFIGRSGKFLPPDSFLATLDQLLLRDTSLTGRLRLRFVGRNFPDGRGPLEHFAHSRPDVFQALGKVTKPDAIRLMRGSSCLLLMNTGGKMVRTRPGKLDEYLAVGLRC